jgi:hypothetical protein
MISPDLVRAHLQILSGPSFFFRGVAKAAAF